MAAPVPAADGPIRVLCISSPDPNDPRRRQITQMFDELGGFELAFTDAVESRSLRSKTSMYM